MSGEKKPSPQAYQEESGVEMIGGKAIPFVRLGNEDYWTVTYGIRDTTVREENIGGKVRKVRGTTQLVQHVRPGRGKSAWSAAYDGHHFLSREFKNQLQGIIDTPDGSHLIAYADILSHTPFAMDDPSDFGRSWMLFCLRLRKADEAEFNQLVGQYFRWFCLLPFIADDIASGHPHYTHMLARVIEAQRLEAQRLREQTRGISSRIISAALDCASRLNRVPTKTEVRKDYLHNPDREYMTNSDFSKALAVAGLAWLPVRVQA